MHFGAVADEQGKAAEVRSQYAETLAMWTEVGNSWAVAYALEELASLAATQARPERALHLAGAAAALREALGTPVSPIKRANFERTLETARQTLPEQVLAAWWAQGRAMTPEKAIAVALTSDDDAPPEIRRPQGASAGGGLDRLTPREREVAALIARGLTNRQIATELVIATGTAALHSKSVLRKLGFRSRAQVAIWAVQRGLYVPPSD